jgi:hypothetical protein
MRRVNGEIRYEIISDLIVDVDDKANNEEVEEALLYKFIQTKQHLSGKLDKVTIEFRNVE